ncbi:hypothetical protein JD844_011213 [Phrynosoma platyrhinos]|uniref:SAP domain-containing protein n=1 Tax=Phrynosoma platyrhinos TaxID=52577 RepID=A0ABQ7TI11_PHRPL|nr:hypothetical protein JD844_011213 [Phrynosoma platyrhinos]
MGRRDVGKLEAGVRTRSGLAGMRRRRGGPAEGGEGKMAAAAETVELHKLKLAELKQECLARGLEAKGNKQDLINRLQAYLEQHAEEEANEEDVLGEETEEEEQKPLDAPVKEEVATEKSAEVDMQPTPDVIHEMMCKDCTGTTRGAEKKVVKITSEIPQMERMQKRAERFNVPVSLESKKAARAARFGMSAASTKGILVNCIVYFFPHNHLVKTGIKIQYC